VANFYKDNDDLRFYFEQWIDWASLVELIEHGFRQKDGPRTTEEAVSLYKDVVEMVGEVVAEEIAPRAAAIDREGAHMKDGEAVLPKAMDEIFKRFNELGLHGLCIPRELGGMNSPLIVYFVTAELMARADVSVMAHSSFHGGIACAMLAFSQLEGTTETDPATGEITKTRFAAEIAEIVAGKAWGCMDITEPDAGSDMAALRAVGEQDAAGNWTVTGQKIFITSGHGKYHFVIARTEKAADPDDPMAGLDGLSFFLVPAYQDEGGTRKRIVSLDRIEEKLGHHGSVTAALTFDKAPAQLIGKRGEGFRYMLHLMNNARLGVGYESIGMCEAAYRMARDYAAGRPSMGKPIARHELIADYLDEMRTDIQGLRALCMYGAIHEERAERRRVQLKELPDDHIDRKRFETEVRRDKRKARRVTPLLKYLGAEKAVEMARRAIQIHGGNGYIKEYGAEKLLRDSLVMPIYEGTSQIQALMAMKDTLGNVLKRPQAFVRKVAQTKWKAMSAEGVERRVAKIQALSLSAQQHLVAKTAADKFRTLSGRPMAEWKRELTRSWDPKRDFAYALLHAERLIRILADEAICEILLEQSQRYPERREVLERYLDRAEPRCRFLHDEITTTGARLLGALGHDDGEDQAAG
jgi:alkylation response protein AidB-like acyl-CoA dehydrogenase